MNRLPFFADAHNVPMLIVGGGQVAARKFRWLRRAGAIVDVLSPVLNEDLAVARDAGELHHIAQRFEPSFEARKKYRLVVAATNDSAVNRSIRAWCDQAGIWLNAVDDRDHSNAIFPAVVDRSPVQIAISSDGESPVLARQIREKIEALLPTATGKLARAMGQLRERLRGRGLDLDRRRGLMEEAARSAWHTPASEVDDVVGAFADGTVPAGRVLLVGAGPGDPELLTIKALTALQSADVIVHDRLVSNEILDRARRDAHFIPVGKAPGGECVSQEEINQILVDQARQGQLVCRLKGGDPGVFGRVGEEVHALALAGIECSIIPGITAALAAAASGCIGLTHREQSHALVLATAHGKDDQAVAELAELAGTGRTLAIYMGVRQLPRLSRLLVDRGLADRLPVSIVENASRPEERRIRADVGSMAEVASLHGVQSPALIIVGEVAAASKATSDPVVAASLAEELPMATSG